MKHSNRYVLLQVALVAVALSGCAEMTRPVTGKMEKTDETFTGTIDRTDRRGSSGMLVLVSNRQVHCKGEFVNATRQRANGVLSCDDGRTGSFYVTQSAAVGTGYGDLNGQRFTFVYQ